MGHKFTSFALVLILFLAAAAVVSVEANTNQTCPHKKRSNDDLNKRHYKEPEKCPCALAQAPFTEVLTGLSVFGQDECGATTITGFLSGFNDPKKNNYTFLITDKCGKVLFDITKGLNVKFDNCTARFTAKFSNINLNCDKDGILNAECTPKTTTIKPTHTYYSYYKRDSGSNMQINQNGGSYAKAPIGGI